MSATRIAGACRSATQRKLCVTVLAGGPSAEREVSLASGAAVAAALRRRGHEVFLADIGPDDLSALERPADVVFPALHGRFGEDGTLQAIMQARGLRFVGTQAEGSARAMNKVAAKHTALELGVATPGYQLVDSPGAVTLGLPAVVKPPAEGSSVATTIVQAPEELAAAVSGVVATYGQALVEQFIAGDEITVGILGRQTLPPILVRPRRGFYDYAAKYHDDRTEYVFETGRSAAVLAELAELSLRVFDALGCRHLARVDWIVDRDEHPWFLELNTIPGFTSHSLVPKAAARIGIEFDELVERLVCMALEEPSCDG